MKRKDRLFVATILALCCAFAGCGLNRKPAGLSNALTAAAATMPSPRAPLVVEVFEISPDAAPQEQLIPAVISSDHTALVLAQRDGVIVGLRAEEGERVAQGQELARLSEDDLRAQLRQAQLDVDRLLIEEQQYAALVKVSRAELAQEEALSKDGLSSQRQLDRSKYKFEESTHELDKARLATRTGQAKVETVKIELEKTVIRAPFSGLITHRYARQGTSIVRGDKLFEVAQTAPLEVRFQVPQSEAGRIRARGVVGLSLPGEDRVIARARISRIDPVADAASNSISCRAEVAGSTGWRIGMAVNVRLAQPPASSLIWIPLPAFPGLTVPRRGSAHQILVREGGHCAARTVTVSEIEGDQVGIRSGLLAGDQVILAPPPELKPGDPVEAKKP
ncbi:MAG TPA: efflux RND transporter periplasmic adaptor subunit [Blastocatellia bacterium]|nr:efflux RND transporter periplasmic adaptor subunit [Blastocatellia bacterium]